MDGAWYPQSLYIWADLKLDTYLAQEFRVKIQWRAWKFVVHFLVAEILSNAYNLRLASPPLTSSSFESRSTRFQVPDDDFDSSSDISREESVQILKSHVRAYSVPSSDDDISSDAGNAKSSLSLGLKHDTSACPSTPAIPVLPALKTSGTTPQHPIEIWTEPTPQEELELVSPNKSGIFRRPGDGVSNWHNKLSGMETAPVDEPTIPNSDSEDDAPEVLSTKQRQQTPPKDTSEYFVSEDLDSRNPDDKPFQVRNTEQYKSTVNHQSLVNVPQPLVPSSETRTRDIYIKPANTLADGLNNVEEVPYERESFFDTGCSDFYCQPTNAPAHCVSCSDSVIVGQDINNGIYHAPQRLPSPSDAALARKASAPIQKIHWPPVAEDSTRPTYHESSRNQESSQTIAPDKTSVGSYDWRISEFSRESLFGGLNSSGAHYGDERFSDRFHRDSSSNLRYFSHRINTAANEQVVQDYKATAPWQSTASPFHYNFIYEDFAAPSTTHDKEEAAVEENRHQTKDGEGQPSRLSISDIVNPHLAITRSLKRKADEMRSDETHEDDGGSQIPSPPGSQGVLHDAQPRDIPTEDATKFLNHDDSTEIPSESSPPSQQTRADSDLGQPPNKKVRTSSRAMGIGKFMTGVCVGVAGAFAAFIATIPISVQEEALREMATP